MWRGLPFLLVLMASWAMAQTTTPQATQQPVTFNALLVFNFAQEQLAARVFDASGQKPMPCQNLSVQAFGEARGSKIEQRLQNVDANGFQTSLAISDGGWNLVFTCTRPDGTALMGAHIINAARAESAGQVALVAESADNKRLGGLVAWLFGVPLALALIVFLFSLRPKPLARP